MKLYEPLQEFIWVGNKRIRVDLDFRNVLRMMDILADEDLTEEAREYLAVKCVCKRPRKGVYKAIRELLFPKQVQWHQRIMDFAQDADYIRAAFRQTYNIDLFRDKLHWYEFSCYLANLPEGSKYAEILSIRARPMPAATKYNTDERKWLMKAKLEYGIHYSEKEEEMNYKQSLKQLAEGMEAMARR